jgi:phenylalanyl-tRNA synthetase beta chain
MLPTGLECVAYNLNRKNSNLVLFEFGKTYSIVDNTYQERQNLAIYITGNINKTNWNSAARKSDMYFAKGIGDAIFSVTGVANYHFAVSGNNELDECLTASVKDINIAVTGAVNKLQLEQFSIKQPVYFICFDWENLISLCKKNEIIFDPIPKFPQVQRDLSILVNRKILYTEIEELVKSLHIEKLQNVQLFDVFENEKLGENKKSFAINLTFLDKEKTMTDEEIEFMMNKIISNLENKLNAVIRSNG